MRLICLIFFLSIISYSSFAQTDDKGKLWHNKERIIRYQPEGNDITITNGNRRFTRALYGTNTAFRLEAGDQPEFAMYMPGMGGNIKFGLVNGDSSKWLINANKIKATYRAGSMLYDIEDNMLGNGKLHLVVLAMGDAEGIVIKMQFENVPNNIKLVFAYGGASGKKFSRDGDMGPDPESSFYLKPENCSDNSYNINKNNFLLKYGTGVVAEWDPYVNKNFASDTVKASKIGKEQQLIGFVPAFMQLQIANSDQQISPARLLQSKQNKASLIAGIMQIKKNENYFFAIQKADSGKSLLYSDADKIFNNAEAARKKIADRIKIVTPDKYINTLGGVLSIAADAVWDNPTFMHGAIGWRMRLNGWRGPYVGDVLGWHDRAKTHFKAYSLSQVTTPLTGPVVMDTALHLARSLEKMGTSIFSSGYISRNPNGDFRPHHYDMNLVYIDALLRHFKWTGDIKFAKEMWPCITRHLAWEKRNFDADNDGLYDAYAAIWASDALQYSGGAVTHSSAYNYKANKEVAIIAKLIGEDAKPFEEEAAKILKAINTTLWMPNKGSYAEFKDLLGNKLLHPNAAVWTMYHSIDSDVPDVFQAYQSMKYIDENIPHIPVRAKGLEDGFETISTSKWMPYDWSLNNVATAEVMHTALANWQAGRNDKAFNLFKSELLSTMYLGGSAGNIGQISFYDAARGEAYRDFADPVAMTARSLVEGLFGILPNALIGELVIKPGFPATWNNATISTPDISFEYKRKNKQDVYTIVPNFEKKMALKLMVKANGAKVQSVLVNLKKATWKNVADALGSPMIEISSETQTKYIITINWLGNIAAVAGLQQKYITGDKINLQFPSAIIQNISDPQHVLQTIQKNNNKISANIAAAKGSYTFFVQLKQNDFNYWHAIDIVVKDAVEITAAFTQAKNGLQFSVINNTNSTLNGSLVVNAGANAFAMPLELKSNSHYTQMNMAQENIISGSNVVSFSWDNKVKKENVINWNVDGENKTAQTLDISQYFNDKVTNIFKNQYLSPRPTVATLQLPTQGIGDWTHPLKTANIDDKGLRKLADNLNRIVLPQGIPFSTPSDTLLSNILFTSQWDNYPKEAIVPLTGKASHAYLLMAGSTNPMQSRLVNGAVIISYTDNSADTLLLKNPETWWPIEQDYMDDGFAFTIDAAKPIRIHLKTGKIVSEYDNIIKTYEGKIIDGGAATVLDMPLNATKTLKELKLQTIANDVVIGLMAVTLIR
jgi:HD-GYP domain-containing protein (c-di-GMP phosphodiesterase class II)